MLDALLALFTATMLALYFLSLMMTTNASADGAQQTTIAYNAARQAIGNVRALRGAPLAARTDAALVGPVPQLAALGSGGEGRLTIQPFRAPVQRVAVTIRWREGGQRRARAITLATLVAPGGVTP